MNPRQPEGNFESSPPAQDHPSFAQIPDHELLRQVGRGSYGEVWLGRNALGAYRAVKIVYRNTFTHDRPFEREFNGIQKFEPISRSHEGLVDILQVGRNEQGGYFYYVMELADPAASAKVQIQSSKFKTQDLAPDGPTPQATLNLEPGPLDSYQPRTLAHEAATRGRLPAAECVQIGLALTSALAYLHKHGLVHRDIKPSSIIFVNGQPKLADIGLVADVSEARSYVGTEGFIAPEGPGAAQSDIYSLGKVLYVLSTGKDRLEYPELPTRLGEADEQVELIELNEIVLKACRADPLQRYPSAEKMRADLLLLQSGRSIKHLRKLERRLAVASKIGLAAVAIALLAVGAYVGSIKQIHRAQRAEHQATETLTKLELQRAEDFFAGDKSAPALVMLANVLRREPTHQVAATRLLCALSQRDFALPVIPPLRHGGQVTSGQFSPDGLRVVTGAKNNTAQVWDARTGQPLTPPLRHEREDRGIRCAQFSPDSTRVVTASADDTVRIWDGRTGQLLVGPLRHQLPVSWAQFSPDGERVVTASSDMTARVWDAHTGQPLTEPLRHEGKVYSAQFSPDGRRVATRGEDRTIRVWDAITGQPLHAPIPVEAQILFVEFSPDGQRLVTACQDNAARVFDARTGQLLVGPLRHEGEVSCARFSPNGLRIVTASDDQTAIIWDADSGQPATAPLQHDFSVTCACFSPDGRRVLTVADDHAVRLWDARTGQSVCEAFFHDSFVLGAEFSPDGQHVLSWSDDKTARIWDVRPGALRAASLLHEAGVNGVQFSTDGRKLLTASAKRETHVSLWDVRTSQLLHRATLEVTGAHTDCQLSPDGERVVTVGPAHTARVWGARTGQPLTGPLQHNGNVHWTQFSPDSQRVVTASSDNTTRIWDARSGQLLAEPLRHDGTVYRAAFSPDGQRVATASFDNTARTWNASTGQPLSPPLRHESDVLSVQFSPDGQRLLTASMDNTARVWDARTGQPLTRPCQHDGKVHSAEWSADGRWMVTASDDQTARVWDALRGQPVSEPLRHRALVKAAHFSPDGQRVVTFSADHTARVWDARTGQPLTEPLRHEDGISSACFSPDGRRVATASADHTARIWEVPVAPLPIPSWLPELAEAVAGKRANAQGVTEPVSGEELLKLKQRLLSAPAADTNRFARRDAQPSTDFYTRWIQWFFADRATRPASFSSTP